MIGIILIILSLVVVAGTLFAGMATMWVGGDTAEKWSNRLMRYRVLAQAVAIGIILVVIYSRSQG